LLISIVIPAHNEALNLAQCLDEVARGLSGAGWDFELLVVDDGSSDDSWDLLRDLVGSAPWGGRLRALRFSRNFGKEAAILAGLRAARGVAVVVLDADLQHPPVLIPRMLELWREGGVDVVEAVKRDRQRESWARRMAARLYYRTFALASGLEMQDSTDFKLLDRRVVDQYLALPESGRFFRGLTSWLGFRSIAVAFDPAERSAGNTSWRLGDLLDMARRTIVGFSSLPLRLVTWLGVFGLVFSAGLTVQTLWYQWQGLAEEGFPTVILLILGMGSMILLSLGLIGEYISEIYSEVKKRPSYVLCDQLPAPTTDPQSPDGRPG